MKYVHLLYKIIAAPLFLLVLFFVSVLFALLAILSAIVSSVDAVEWIITGKYKDTKDQPFNPFSKDYGSWFTHFLPK